MSGSAQEYKTWHRIPLRLTDEERLLFDLLSSALNVVDYVNKVDVTHNLPDAYCVSSIQDMYRVMQAMLLSSVEIRDTVKAQIKAKANLNGDYLARMFEVGRRYKRMNPDKLRAEYGKLMWFLMDVAQDRAGVSSVKGTPSADEVLIPIVDVHRALESVGLSFEATHPHSEDVILATDPTVPEATRTKHMERLVSKLGWIAPHHRAMMTRCLQSINDARVVLEQNTQSLTKLIDWLDAFQVEAEHTSLRITAGRDGSCLSHSHKQQFLYVKESLTLWRIVQRDLPLLWEAVEHDLLDRTNGYRYVNTGQGHHRMQSAPRVGQAISACLREAQSVMGGWVGSTVIHLGDRDVPNALVFIDKYTQVPRIVNPIVQVIEHLDKESPYPGVTDYIRSLYGSCAQARTAILRDFYSHAFNGSGDDGGSCIDGRLTSTWNWCSLIEKKKYYPIFLLGGFIGFDGGF